jgi:hypothetical protein
MFWWKKGVSEADFRRVVLAPLPLSYLSVVVMGGFEALELALLSGRSVA